VNLRVLAVAALGVALAPLGCVEVGDVALFDRVEEVEVECGEPPSFAVDVAPIFAGSCALSSCHDAQTAMLGLVLEPDVAYDNLLGGSSLVTGASFVVPDAADDSYVVDRLLARNGATLMPPVGGPLSAEDISTIVCWIDAGAPE
jgi:hypothetical protein